MIQPPVGPLSWLALVLLSLLACRPIPTLKVHCECDWAPLGSRYEGRWMHIDTQKYKILDVLTTLTVLATLPLLVCVIGWFVTMLKLHFRRCLVHQLKRVG